MVGKDAVCKITVTKDDEIDITQLGQCGDRWFLAFAPFHKNAEYERTGEVMYDPTLSKVFVLSLFRLCTPDAFTFIPDLSETVSRVNEPLPDSLNLLDTDAVIKAIEDFNITIEAYTSHAQYSKARTEYFVRNSEMYGIDLSTYDKLEEFHNGLVHPDNSKIENDSKWKDEVAEMADAFGKAASRHEDMG